MMLTPRSPGPFESSLALRISLRRAWLFFSTNLEEGSNSNMPMPAVPMTPMPPSLATAEARPARDMPTDMPPWMMGSGTIRSPIFNAGNLLKRPPM